MKYQLNHYCKPQLPLRIVVLIKCREGYFKLIVQFSSMQQDFPMAKKDSKKNSKASKVDSDVDIILGMG